MGLKLSSNALILSFFLLLLCLFSEIGGSETTHRKLEVPIRELSVGPSCSCGGGKGSVKRISKECPRPRPCPPPHPHAR
ncbi:hypothetical protein CARUB_v10022285mg [Capsella rubella]|uniref:Uncharacterized protein n=1 Tax=Capsella rubella TaxID=81985 RepID=R0I9C5_9BRAS|nr:hypothetical protein CARUB_v10022285mg [Capsella rubella]